VRLNGNVLPAMSIGSKGLILAAVRAIYLDVYVASATFKCGRSAKLRIGQPQCRRILVFRK
jgi:hypothetical protein